MKKRILLFPMAAGIVACTLMSSKTGPAANGMGDRTNIGCKPCHDGGSGVTTIQLGLIDDATAAPVTDGKYIPGKTYTISELGGNTSGGITHFGFQVAAVNSAGSQAGTFTIVNTSNTQAFSAAGIHGAEHKQPIAKMGNIFNPNIKWKAPAAGTGPVTFRIALNGNNNDNSFLGDVPAIGKATLQEKSATAVGHLATASFRLFPNPASGAVTLDFGQAQEGAYSVLVFNMEGGLVLDRQLQVKTGKRSFEVSTEGLRAGLYHVLVSGREGEQVLKFVKQ